MAFDPDTATTVLFGGRSGDQILGDTWTWDGSTWTEQTPPASPPPLESAAMAYDAASHQLLLFGGAGRGDSRARPPGPGTAPPGPRLNPTTTPPARSAPSLVYDPATATAVLFGGFAASGASLGDTWSWDGTTWNAAIAGRRPAITGSGGGGLRRRHGVVVVSGGRTGPQLLGDTWVCNGANWAQRNPSAAPSPRQDAAMAALGDGMGAVLFGGDPGAGWAARRSLDLGRRPVGGDARLGRTAGSSAAPPWRPVPTARFVLFGGIGANGALGDTWTLTTAAGQDVRSGDVDLVDSP